MPKLSLAQASSSKVCEGKVKNTQTPDDLMGISYVLQLLGPDHPVEKSDFVSAQDQQGKWREMKYVARSSRD